MWRINGHHGTCFGEHGFAVPCNCVLVVGSTHVHRVLSFESGAHLLWCEILGPVASLPWLDLLTMHMLRLPCAPLTCCLQLRVADRSVARTLAVGH